MKKLLVILSCTFVIAGCATAEKPPYEIDLVATANATWEAGDTILALPEFAVKLETCTSKIINQDFCDGDDIHRVFLGITTDGYYLIQDIYDFNNEPASIPYRVISEEGAVAYLPFIHGEYKSWYPSGNAMSECSGFNGEGRCIEWYETGEKFSEFGFKNGHLIENNILWFRNGQPAMIVFLDEDGNMLSIPLIYREDGSLDRDAYIVRDPDISN